MTPSLRKIGEVGDEKFINLVERHPLVRLTADRLGYQLCVAEGTPGIPSSIGSFIHLGVADLGLPLALVGLLGETGEPGQSGQSSRTVRVRGAPALRPGPGVTATTVGATRVLLVVGLVSGPPVLGIDWVLVLVLVLARPTC